MRRKRYRKRKKFPFIKVLVSVTLVFGILATFVLVYFKMLSNSCVRMLSSVDKFYVEGNVLYLNDVEVNLDSPLLFVKEYNGSKVKRSTIVELVESLNKGNVNFSKKFNLVVYEINRGDYKIYSSSKVKLRFSEMDNGYLLEVDNRTSGYNNFFYNSSGEVSQNPSEGWEHLSIKGGLNQIYVPSNVDINSLSRNIINAIKDY